MPDSFCRKAGYVCRKAKKHHMRVTHLSAARSWRGGEQQLAWLMCELDRMGVCQQLLCVDGSPLHRWVARHLPRVILVPYWKRNAADPLTARLVQLSTRDFGADVVHAHDAHAHTMAWLAAVLWGQKKPIVVSRRVANPPSTGVLSRKKYFHRRLARVLCVSKHVREVMHRWGLPAERLEVVYDGIDLQRFASAERHVLRQLAGWAHDTPVVGYVGALSEEKSLPTFLHAARRIADRVPDVRFALLGEGPLRKHLEKLAMQLGLAPHTWFAGFREDVAALLPGFDVLLFPSKKEGLGTTLLDAMAAGVAVVATRTGGIPEVIREPHTGRLATPGDAATLAAHAIELLCDSPLRKRLTAAARERVRLFSKEEMAARTFACYRAVL